jgi:hypothetical protein
MKKTLFALLAIVMAFAMVSCNSSGGGGGGDPGTWDLAALKALPNGLTLGVAGGDPPTWDNTNKVVTIPPNSDSTLFYIDFAANGINNVQAGDVLTVTYACYVESPTAKVIVKNGSNSWDNFADPIYADLENGKNKTITVTATDATNGISFQHNENTNEATATYHVKILSVTGGSGSAPSPGSDPTWFTNAAGIAVTAVDGTVPFDSATKIYTLGPSFGAIIMTLPDGLLPTDTVKITYACVVGTPTAKIIIKQGTKGDTSYPDLIGAANANGHNGTTNKYPNLATTAVSTIVVRGDDFASGETKVAFQFNDDGNANGTFRIKIISITKEAGTSGGGSDAATKTVTFASSGDITPYKVTISDVTSAGFKVTNTDQYENAFPCFKVTFDTGVKLSDYAKIKFTLNAADTTYKPVRVAAFATLPTSGTTIGTSHANIIAANESNAIGNANTDYPQTLNIKAALPAGTDLNEVFIAICIHAENGKTYTIRDVSFTND